MKTENKILISKEFLHLQMYVEDSGLQHKNLKKLTCINHLFLYSPRELVQLYWILLPGQNLSIHAVLLATKMTCYLTWHIMDLKGQMASVTILINLILSIPRLFVTLKKMRDDSVVLGYAMSQQDLCNGFDEGAKGEKDRYKYPCLCQDMYLEPLCCEVTTLTTTLQKSPLRTFFDKKFTQLINQEAL